MDDFASCLADFPIKAIDSDNGASSPDATETARGGKAADDDDDDDDDDDESSVSGASIRSTPSVFTFPNLSASAASPAGSMGAPSPHDFDSEPARDCTLNKPCKWAEDYSHRPMAVQHRIAKERTEKKQVPGTGVIDLSSRGTAKAVTAKAPKSSVAKPVKSSARLKSSARVKSSTMTVTLSSPVPSGMGMTCRSVSIPVTAAPSAKNANRHHLIVSALYDAAEEGIDARWTDDGLAVFFPDHEDGVKAVLDRVPGNRIFAYTWDSFTRNMRKMGFFTLNLKSRYALSHKYIIAHSKHALAQGHRDRIKDIKYVNRPSK